MSEAVFSLKGGGKYRATVSDGPVGHESQKLLKLSSTDGASSVVLWFDNLSLLVEFQAAVTNAVVMYASEGSKSV